MNTLELQDAILGIVEYTAPDGGDWWTQKEITTELRSTSDEPSFSERETPYHLVRHALEVLERKGGVERRIDGNRNCYALVEETITKVQEEAPEEAADERDISADDALLHFVQASVLLRTGEAVSADMVAEILAAAEVGRAWAVAVK
jgi:hypothetical protein